MTLTALPPKLQRSLQELAGRYRQAGAELFIFGSFARGDARPTSDLDLGVEWLGERSANVLARLYDDVDTLPTIRKIEVVDFTQVDTRFREVAEREKIYLAERAQA